MVPALNHPSFRMMCAAIVLCGSSTNTTAQLSSNCAGANDNGICDTEDALHCGPGTVWDFETALCVVECPSDLNSDGAVAIGDLLILLSDFANFCEDLE